MPPPPQEGYRIGFGTVRNKAEVTQAFFQQRQPDVSRLVTVAQDIFHVKQRIMRAVPKTHPDRVVFEKQVSAALARGSTRHYDVIEADTPRELQDAVCIELQKMLSDVRALIPEFRECRGKETFQQQLADCVNLIGHHERRQQGEAGGAALAAPVADAHRDEMPTTWAAGNRYLKVSVLEVCHPDRCSVFIVTLARVRPGDHMFRGSRTPLLVATPTPARPGCGSCHSICPWMNRHRTHER